MCRKCTAPCIHTQQYCQPWRRAGIAHIQSYRLLWTSVKIRYKFLPRGPFLPGNTPIWGSKLLCDSRFTWSLISSVIHWIYKSAFCLTHASVLSLWTSKPSRKTMKVSHLEGLFFSERNPGRWFVCTASQRPPVRTSWRVMSETETKGRHAENECQNTSAAFKRTENASFKADKCFFNAYRIKEKPLYLINNIHTYVDDRNNQNHSMVRANMQDATKFLPEKINSIWNNFLIEGYFSGEQKTYSIQTQQIPNYLLTVF